MRPSRLEKKTTAPARVRCAPPLVKAARNAVAVGTSSASRAFWLGVSSVGALFAGGSSPGDAGGAAEATDATEGDEDAGGGGSPPHAARRRADKRRGPEGRMGATIRRP